jgi:hypothetical protein
VESIFERHSVVVRVFVDRIGAVAAVRDLYRAGFREEEIGIASLLADGDLTEAETITEDGRTHGRDAFHEASAGAATGEIVAMGIASGVISTIGPVIAGGTLAPILLNDTETDALIGTLGAISGDLYPSVEANFYQDQVKAGRTIVAVKADERYHDAAEILARDGGYDRERPGR